MTELQHDLQANNGHGTVMLFNDLKAAIEVNLGEGWQILYPEKGLKFWDQRFTSGSMLEGWSWHLWQASSGTWMATLASSTGDDFASFWGLQWSCCTLAWEWRRLSGKRPWTQATAWKAALEADRTEKHVACSQGPGAPPGLLASPTSFTTSLPSSCGTKQRRTSYMAADVMEAKSFCRHHSYANPNFKQLISLAYFGGVFINACGVFHGVMAECHWSTGRLAGSQRSTLDAAANIEKAVHCGVELQVFFFENMKGQGKVQSFATAGAEHCQRECIWQKKEKFKESVAYREAVAAGLDSLSKDAGDDSSSQHSRELQRLFWAWLPEEDRDFLAASEGLGNSQKAEVAWLERKGYQYTQVDIIEFNQSSKRIISLEP